MFGKKFSTTAKRTLLLALVLVVAGGVIVYAHFGMTSHPVAWNPPLFQLLASWGS